MPPPDEYLLDTMRMRRNVSRGSPRNLHRIQGGFSINSIFDQVIERSTLAVGRRGFSICFRSGSARMERLWASNAMNRLFSWRDNSLPNITYGMLRCCRETPK